MIYAFNEDKSKVEVIGKKDIVTFTRQLRIYSKSVGELTINNTIAEIIGLDDISKYIVIDCAVRDLSVVEDPVFNHAGYLYYNGNNYPLVLEYTSQNNPRIKVKHYNPHNSDINYHIRITLLKLPD